MTRLTLSLFALCLVLVGLLLVEGNGPETRSIGALLRYLFDPQAPPRGRWGVAAINLGFWGFVLLQAIPQLVGLVR